MISFSLCTAFSRQNGRFFIPLARFKKYWE